MPNAYDLSFTPEMEDLILDGYKVMTSRRLPFSVGYSFTIGGACYRVIASFEAPYPMIRDLFFYAEGFCSPEELDTYFEGLGYSTLQKDRYFCMIFELVRGDPGGF